MHFRDAKIIDQRIGPFNKERPRQDIPPRLCSTNEFLRPPDAFGESVIISFYWSCVTSPENAHVCNSRECERKSIIFHYAVQTRITDAWRAKSARIMYITEKNDNLRCKRLT